VTFWRDTVRLCGVSIAGRGCSTSPSVTWGSTCGSGNVLIGDMQTLQPLYANWCSAGRFCNTCVSSTNYMNTWIVQLQAQGRFEQARIGYDEIAGDRTDNGAREYIHFQNISSIQF
jgi:hypothetical protein